VRWTVPLIGIAGGIATAVFWGASAVAAAQASRMIGTRVALAWVYLFGLVLIVPLAVSVGVPDVGADRLAWHAVATPAAVSAIALLYAAVRRGPIVVVTPIIATQGCVAALFAFALGERLNHLAVLGLGAVTLGSIALIAKAAPPVAAGGADAPVSPRTAAIPLAGLCAVVGGITLYTSARAGESPELDWMLWMLASYRVLGVIAFTVPVTLARRLVWPRGAMGLLFFAAVADAAGFLSYILGTSGSNVAVPAVLASQAAVVSVIIAILVLKERLRTAQAIGLVTLLSGVALIAASQS